MLKEGFERQIKVLDDMIQAFKELESAVVSRNTDSLSKSAVSVEELGLEIDKIELERTLALQSLGLATVKDYVERSNLPDASDVSFLSVEVVEKLNELMIIMDEIRQIIQFENQYAEFLNCFIKGVQPSTYSFPPNGQNDNVNSMRSTYARPLYDQFK